MSGAGEPLPSPVRGRDFPAGRACPIVNSLVPIALDRQLRVLSWYAAFTFPFACIPFLYFYFLDHGIDLPRYGTLIAVYYLSMVVLEVPTGALADRYGKKLAMVVGPVVLAVGFWILWACDTFAAFCVGEAVFGLGHSILSGPPSALLFTSLEACDRAGEYQRHESRLHAMRLLGTGTAFLAGGALAASVGIGPTILLSAVLCVVAAGAACFLVEPAGHALPIAPRPSLWRTAWNDLRTPDVAWVIAYYVLLFCLLRFPFHTYQPFLEAADADDYLSIGVLFFALNVFAAPCSRLAPTLVERFGHRALFWAMPALLAISLLVMADQVNTLGIALFFVHQIPFGVHWPVVHSFVQRRIQHEARATVLSVLSFAGRASFAAVFPLIASAGTVETGYSIVGWIGLAAIAPMMWAGRRVGRAG